MDITYKICQKCLKRKRNNAKKLCTVCFNLKSIKVDKTLTAEETEYLREEVIAFKYKLEVTQNSWICLQDINDIIEFHWRVYKREYIGNDLGAGAQLEIMWNDLKRFCLM